MDTRPHNRPLTTGLIEAVTRLPPLSRLTLAPRRVKFDPPARNRPRNRVAPVTLALPEGETPPAAVVDCARCGTQAPRFNETQVRCSRCGCFLLRLDEYNRLLAQDADAIPARPLDPSTLAQRARNRQRLERAIA